LRATPENTLAAQKLIESGKHEALGTSLSEYLEVLRSPNCHARLSAYIEDIDTDEVQWRWMPWAMEAASVISMPDLRKCLRIRLDRNAVNASAKQRRLQAPGHIVSRLPLDGHYRQGAGGIAIVDRWHDQALLMYWRLGGELKERERLRLQYHGWLGDQTENIKGILIR
jgi:hypothetical protein